MSHKRFLFIIPFLALSFLSASDKDDKYFDTDFDIIGPFEEGSDDYTLTGRVTPLLSCPQVRERMVVNVIDGPLVSSVSKSLHSVTKDRTYLLTFTLPFKSDLTLSGLSISIGFLLKTNKPLQYFTFNIKPIKKKRINPRDYIDEYFISEDIVVDPDNYPKIKDEKIMFDETLDYFNVDNYYRLDLKDALITYECGLPCPQCVAHFHFVDYLKIFPYLDSDELVPTFDIPLSIIVKKSHICFAFPRNMYVKPDTLEMSLEARPGFMETPYFYLPKNRCEELLDQNFTINVESFGHAKISFSWDMKYTNNNLLIGDCSNSDYCVVGHMVNG